MSASSPTRWLFGDHLGPHFLDADDQPVLLVESRRAFARRRFHRQKAHLVLSAIRHRAAELGERCDFRQVGGYAEALDGRASGGPLSVCHPTTRAALAFVRARPEVQVLPARGFATGMDEFAAWAEGRGARRLLMEDHYRAARRRLDVLMDGDEPAGGRWNFDEENREPPPKRPGRRATAGTPHTLGVPEPWWPEEDEIDEQVRADLDRRAPAGGDRAATGEPGTGREPVGRDRVPAADQAEQGRGDEQPVGRAGPGRRRQPGDVELVVQHTGVPLQGRPGRAGPHGRRDGDLRVLPGGQAQRGPGAGRVGAQLDQAADQLVPHRAERGEPQRGRIERGPVAPGGLGLRRRQQYMHGQAPYVRWAGA